MHIGGNRCVGRLGGDSPLEGVSDRIIGLVAIPSKHKSLTLLAGVLLAQLLLLAVQIKRDSRGRLIRVWAISAAYPFERSGAWGFGKVRGVWTHYFALQTTERENEALRVENDALKLTISQLQSRAAEADRLAGILGFKQSHDESADGGRAGDCGKRGDGQQDH